MRMPTLSITEIANKYDIDVLAYFGSYQTEYYNKESDIDVGFLSSRTLSTDELCSLLEELIIFHRKSEIDLVDLRTADPILRYEVALNGRVLYEREKGLFEKYSLYYIKRHYELKHVMEDRVKRIGKAIEEVLEDARQLGDLQ